MQVAWGISITISMEVSNKPDLQRGKASQIHLDGDHQLTVSLWFRNPLMILEIHWCVFLYPYPRNLRQYVWQRLPTSSWPTTGDAGPAVTQTWFLGKSPESKSIWCLGTSLGTASGLGYTLDYFVGIHNEIRWPLLNLIAHPVNDRSYSEIWC